MSPITVNTSPVKTRGEGFSFAFLGISSLLWLAAYLPQWFSWDWLLSDLLGGLSILTGVFGSLLWLICGAIYRNPKMLTAGGAMALLTIVVISGTCEAIKARGTLARNESSYTEIVSEVLASPSKWKEVPYSDSVTVDLAGGGVRIAFDLGAGFIDDFKSIVYDERGDVIKPRESGLDPNVPFGGDFARAVHLRGNWYFLYLYPESVPGQ
jgi:hypothetical protein